MHRTSFRLLPALAFITAPLFAQNSAAPIPANASGTAVAESVAKPKEPLVEFEMMTWPEVKDALAAGKTTALFYTGGTEQRGPQNVNGGHNLMGKATVKAIALKLGNAIAMPVLPYTPNNASATLPGTIGLTPEILAALLERVSEQAITTGFKNIILMGDHGGGQPNVYREVAKKLDDKYAPQGIHVYYCDEVYSKAGADFDKWLTDNGYPASSHADPGRRRCSSRAATCGCGRSHQDRPRRPVRPPGQPRDSTAQRASTTASRATRATLDRGAGKKVFDMKIEYAVKQIRALTGAP
jgi:creatinine amidohydrolase/Fe(II)-dependent formamide hydrolase-like protein